MDHGGALWWPILARLQELKLGLLLGCWVVGVPPARPDLWQRPVLSEPPLNVVLEVLARGVVRVVPPAAPAQKGCHASRHQGHVPAQLLSGVGGRAAQQHALEVGPQQPQEGLKFWQQVGRGKRRNPCLLAQQDQRSVRRQHAVGLPIEQDAPVQDEPWCRAPNLTRASAALTCK